MKSRLTNRISNGFSRLWAALKSHPVELLILLHATVSATVNGFTWWQQSAPYAAFATVAAFCLSRFRKGLNWAQWVYWVVIPLYVLAAFLPTGWPKSTEFTVLNFLLPAAYLLTLPTREGQHFTERFYRLLHSLAVAIALASVVFILLLLVTLTLEVLFSLTRIWGRLMDVSLSFCYIFLAPMLFITLESQEEQPEVATLVEITINYVLTPVLLLYNLILYVYLAVILVKWELPESSVSSMVLAFTIVAVAIRLVRPLLAKQPLKWYFRWFGLFALPLVALFWVAVSYRIGQYGITVDRCNLFVAGILMTIYLIGTVVFNAHKLMSAQAQGNYLFTVLLVLCGVVLAVGGPLSARQISLRSQTAIVREKAEALGILASDGTVDRETFLRSEADSVNRKEHRAIYQAMQYIERDLADTTAVRASFGMTSAEYLDRLSSSTSDYAIAGRPERDRYEDEVEDPVTPTYYISFYGEETMDVSGYSRMEVNTDVEYNPQVIPYPGGNVPADTLLATQLAKIGYTLESNLDRDRLVDNKSTLCHYQSPDGKALIIFRYMQIQRTDSLNHITSATIQCALAR